MPFRLRRRGADGNRKNEGTVGMTRLAMMLSRILDASDTVHLIFSPLHKLLRMGAVFFLLYFALFALSFTHFVMVTFPALLFEAYFYYIYCKLWKTYRYSTVYLVLNPILAFCSAIGLLALLD